MLRMPHIGVLAISKFDRKDQIDSINSFNGKCRSANYN